jgi:hypothetical protein
VRERWFVETSMEGDFGSVSSRCTVINDILGLPAGIGGGRRDCLDSSDVDYDGVGPEAQIYAISSHHEGGYQYILEPKPYERCSLKLWIDGVVESVSESVVESVVGMMALSGETYPKAPS